jgi:hypothetical protein
MKKYNSKNYSVRHLKELLKRHADFVLKHDQGKQNNVSLEQEEKQLLASADLADRKQISRIREVRLQRDISTAQVAKFANAGGEILDEINEECNELARQIVRTCRRYTGQSVRDGSAKWVRQVTNAKLGRKPDGQIRVLSNEIMNWHLSWEDMRSHRSIQISRGGGHWLRRGVRSP